MRGSRTPTAAQAVAAASDAERTPSPRMSPRTFNVWRIRDGKAAAVIVGIADYEEAMAVARG